MKKILITGKGSYIGSAMERRLAEFPDEYQVYTLDMLSDAWRDADFKGYDAVFHVAGIAHIKETENNADLYYMVNRDLAVQTAQKAKSEGVGQFIFLSSMSVYGQLTGLITSETEPHPNTNYGKSKLQAEEALLPMQAADFHIAILRPPMVYGSGCKGNYPRLASLARKLPFFPQYDNSRSMIYIENLCEFVRLLIDSANGGMFYPQNIEYVRTSDMVSAISRAHGKNISMTKLFNPAIHLCAGVSTMQKVFGDLRYSYDMSGDTQKYCLVDFERSIERTERGSL